MTQGIMLDALFPGTPDQLVAQCQLTGAVGCFVYAFRLDAAGNDLGIGGWTPDHAPALHAAGRVAPAIIVPGNVPGDVQPMLDAAAALGCDRVVMFDLETFSTPPAAWLQSAIGVARALGWKVLRYGDLALLAQYPAADGDFVSHGLIPVEAGSYLPVPALPQSPGVVGDQYAVDVGGFDVSVCDLLGGGIMATIDDVWTWITENGDPLLRDIQKTVDTEVWNWITQNGDPLLRDIQKSVEVGTGGALGSVIGQIASDVSSIKTTVAGLAASIPAAGTALTAAQAQQLQEAHDAILRVEAALRTA